LFVKILGSAAGGGFPQWNCNTRLSHLAWNGANSVQPRTQSSVAVSSDGEKWVLLNASPDIRQQIAAHKELQPQPDGGLRNSPIQAVVLTNGDVDHVAGLLSLRERHAFSLYATADVHASLEANTIFKVLNPAIVSRLAVNLSESYVIAGLTMTPFPVPGKVALYLENDESVQGAHTGNGATIGLEIRTSGDRRIAYIPGCAAINDAVIDRVSGADCLLFDGTVYTDTELADAGVGEKTGRRMGHVPITGEGGSLFAFDNAELKRKIYIHINTTNPILENGSKAERTVISAGWEVGFDGMSITL